MIEIRAQRGSSMSLLARNENGGMRARPVSYTHLDVYKRQGFIWPFRGNRAEQQKAEKGVGSDTRQDKKDKRPDVVFCKFRDCLLYTS